MTLTTQHHLSLCVSTTWKISWILLVTISLTSVRAKCPDKCVCREERNEHLENQVVDCSHQGLTSIPSFDPEWSVATWKLVLAGNPLRSIPEGDFRNLTDLKELDLSGCQISEIKTGSFAGPTRLDTLILKDNEISSLPEHMFHRHSPAVADLDLSGNRLSLANFVVAGKYLINLRSLNLANNQIRDEEIPRGFESLTGLMHLDLSNNSLGNLENNFFENNFRTLVQLESLDLSYNHLRPSSETLKTLPMNLNYLNLAGNPHLGLQDNLRNTLYGIPSGIAIRTLNLSDVGLSASLEAKVFDFLPKLNLEVLDLSNNNIAKLDAMDLAKKMPFIRDISLRNNRLTSVRSLGKMESLERLDLSDNSLKNFPIEIFQMPELMELNLRNNAIRKMTIQADANENMMQLRSIDISRNKLTTIIVAGNHQVWKLFPSLRTLDLSFNLLSNVDTLNMEALGELTVLDLRHNRFSQIHNNLITLIKKLPSLEEVRIHQNPFQCTCRWLREAEANIPKHVEVTGLNVTFCRTDALDAPTVASFADENCHVHLPGMPTVKATIPAAFSRDVENDVEPDLRISGYPDAGAVVSKPDVASEGLGAGATVAIVVVLVVLVAGVAFVTWKHWTQLRGRLRGGPMSYTEILDEYHPPDGGGVPL